jgi:plasmid stabilization system protein ParE
MVFRVELAPRAFADLDSIAGDIRERESFESAEKWFNGILRAIESLAEMPQRCRVAEESRDLGREVRVLLYGRKNRAYRVFYAIHGTRTAQVFHVRHWARRTPGSDELEALLEEQF